MIEQKRFSSNPGITGFFLSFFLIISFFLPRIWENNTTVESFNTVLIVIILCMAVHLIRRTSYLFFDHVWNNVGFLILWFIPVFNLIITASQFIWGNVGYMQSPYFVCLMIMFSMPSFLCYYFTVIWIYCKRDIALSISSSFLAAAGSLYCLIRLADKVIVPMLATNGKEIAQLVEKLVSMSPIFSMAVYIISCANFIICIRIFSSKNKLDN